MKIRLTKNLGPLRASALARLDAIIGEQLQPMTSSPVAILRSRKLAEAKRVLAGEGGAPILTAEAAALGIEVAALASVVIAKGATEAVALAEIEAQRQRGQAAIRSAPHPAAIDAALEEILNG